MLRYIGLIFLVIFFTNGCANHLELTPSLDNVSVKNVSINSNNASCTPLITTSDRRLRTNVNYKNISESVAIEWLNDAIKRSYGLISYKEDNKYEKSVINLSLEKAYISHTGSTQTGIVLLKAEQNDISKHYRGRKSKMNWFSSKAEYHHSLNTAILDAIEQFLDDDDFTIDCKEIESFI